MSEIRNLNIVIVGVGGQGTLLASRILSTLALKLGLDVKASEIHGMAQRGGCVVSHVRIGEECQSPLIPLGKADILVGFEPGEAVRCLPYLAPGAPAVVCVTPVQPVMGSLAGEVYDVEALLRDLRRRVAALTTIDARQVAEICGTKRALNVALLGAVARQGALPIALEDVERALRTKLSGAVLEMNLKALEFGANAKEDPQCK